MREWRKRFPATAAYVLPSLVVLGWLLAAQPWLAFSRSEPPLPTASHGATRWTLEPGQVLRLHVVANSDRRADQAVKLMVRDQVMMYLQGIPQLRESRSLAEMAAVINEHREVLRQLVQEVLRRLGSPYDVRVDVGRHRYEGRYYLGQWVPPGEYASIRIVLGAGRGANWWCVLFPPLCIVPPAVRSEAGGPVIGGTAGLAAPADVDVLLHAPDGQWIASGREAPVRVRLALLEWLERRWSDPGLAVHTP